MVSLQYYHNNITIIILVTCIRFCEEPNCNNISYEIPIR